jgi:ATP-dependent helicase/nuclease subunit B
MGSQSGPGAPSRIGASSGFSASLGEGGMVVASSERAARALTEAYHRARRAQSLSAWPAPNVLDWESFVRAAWLERTPDPRMILNPQQEQSLWAEIVTAEDAQSWLSGPLHRIAALAMDAHRLLCSHAPYFLRASARAGWQQDAAAFSRWLTAFEQSCRAQGVVSPARLPLELISLLETGSVPRAPLLLAGFDRMLPIHKNLFAAWGPHSEVPRPEPAQRVFLYQTPDGSAELAACALWCRQQLQQNPAARLLVITQDTATRRGEIERAFLRFLGDSEGSAHVSRLFEFSLGVPLTQLALARSALLALRWLDEPLQESELDWLISTGHLAADASESLALSGFMRALRRRGLERTQWPLDAFVRQNTGQSLPTAWTTRILHARLQLQEFSRKHTAPRQQSALETVLANPLAWAEFVPQLLQTVGYPGGRALSSAEFQAMHRWEQAIETCASLGFSGRRMAWSAFLTALERTLNETLFSPESEDAPILISGPAESAGLDADGIWFLGASEDAWPASGAANPLLPVDLQRDAEMPHASALLDWRLAEAVTHRLLASAQEIHFSFARTAEGVEARPSRLIVKIAGAPRNPPADFLAPRVPDPLTVWFDDRSQVPFAGGALRGGANVLTAQSQCAFKAFALARLGAEGWEPAQAGLTAAQRGRLLHAVLHSIWGGPPHGIRSHAELLLKLSDLATFVQHHVRTAFREALPAAVGEAMPHAYLALEETRLVTVVSEWLRFEAERVPFNEARTEVDAAVEIGGLALNLRLDRIDRLSDESLLVIDYKTGNVSPRLWELPRPDDVQLPLYAGFALDSAAKLPGGLVFARVRAGRHEFAGRVVDASGQLLAGLGSRRALVKEPLTAEALREWRAYIENLAVAFIEGRAQVNPRDYPKTCERCGLQTLCRVYESRAQFDADGEEDDDEAEAGDA